MKTFYAPASWLAGLLLMASPALGQNYEQLAKQIVTTSAGVKPGELVMITGGQFTLPLMEAIAVEVARAGGQPSMVLSTDKVGHAINQETPLAAIQARKSNNWILQADVLIGLPAYENASTVLTGLSQERRAKFGQVAAASGYTKQLDASKVRAVYIAYPSKSFAAARHLDYASYEQMLWNGVGADYTAIASQAERLKQVLAAGRKVHITSPAGTDLTLELGGRPVFADDGVLSAADQQEKLIYNRTVNLPGGLVFGSCQEASATGRLATTQDYLSDNQALTGLKADVQNGQISNVRADAGAEAFQQQMAAYGPAGMQISRFSIGLNPLLKPQDQQAYSPTTAAGMVYLIAGNNELMGGQNHALSSFSFPIANATVEVDGNVVVRNGQLVSPAIANATPAGKKARK